MLGKAALWRLQMKLRSFFERPKRLHFEFALGSQGWSLFSSPLGGVFIRLSGS